MRRAARNGAGIGLALMLGLTAAACAHDDIWLGSVRDAGVPGADAGNDGDAGGGQACDQNADCDSDQYCRNTSCGTRTGSCDVRPRSCDSTQDPVCGCDGVTYYNDCLRRSNGVGTAAPGACTRNALGCGGGSSGECPARAFCARLSSSPDQCIGDARGLCWVLPTSCAKSQGSGEPLFAPCDPRAPCTDLCNAIRSEQPSFATPRCPH